MNDWLAIIGLASLSFAFFFETRENQKLKAKLAHKEMHCNFCDRAHKDVEVIVAGGSVNSYICAECASIVIQIRDEHRAELIKYEQEAKG